MAVIDDGSALIDELVRQEQREGSSGWNRRSVKAVKAIPGGADSLWRVFVRAPTAVELCFLLHCSEKKALLIGCDSLMVAC